MLLSMTGFGKASVDFEGKSKILVEIRTLNSKYLDLNLRYPAIFRVREPEFRSLLTEKLIRGKVDITIQVEGNAENAGQKINVALVKAYYDTLRNLQSELDNQEPLLNAIFRFPDILSADEGEFDEKEWKEILKATLAAIEQVTDFRKREGAELEMDLTERVSRILVLLKEVEKLDTDRLATIRKRLLKQFEDWKSLDKLDKNRFEEELIYYLEKMDITEEKVRLKTHCDFFRQILTETKIEKGKKLGFVSQEIGREINTIGSKASNAPIQKLVVQMKDELEKIKEQLLNVV
jgi:uncharacterized protein (TIGR00255 family)